MPTLLTESSRPRASDLPIDRPIEGGPSFRFGLRVHRAVWSVVWKCLAGWTPPQFSPWRILLLKLFGARIHPGAAVAASVRSLASAQSRIGSGSISWTRRRMLQFGVDQDWRAFSGFAAGVPLRWYARYRRREVFTSRASNYDWG